MSYLTVGLSSVLGLAIVIYFVSRISRSRGSYESALREAGKDLEFTRKYVNATRRPILSGRALVNRMRAWANGNS